MKFFIRQFKDDFHKCDISLTTTNEGTLQLSWSKGNTTYPLDGGQPTTTYPENPTALDTLALSDILTEKKTGRPLNNPHQVIAVGADENSGNFAFVDVLKYTNGAKGSTGLFKILSNILNPIMYIFVPFADSPVSDWTFIAIASKFEVDGNEITQTFDIDIDRTLSDTCNENLPGIILTKQGNVITAQLVVNSTPISKQNVDIYFETTAGYLTKSRSKTNGDGYATTEVIGAEEGKVKAGFKYFSGKTEINI